MNRAWVGTRTPRRCWPAASSGPQFPGRATKPRGYPAAPQKHAESLAEIQILVAHDPHDAGHRVLLASALGAVGEDNRAIEIYEGVLTEHPDQADVWLHYGLALKTAGRANDAVAAYNRCIALSPGLGEAYWRLGDLKTAPFSAEQEAAMRSQLTNSERSIEDRLHLQFALGRAREEARDYPPRSTTIRRRQIAPRPA